MKDDEYPTYDGTVCSICFEPIDVDYRYCTNCKETVGGLRPCKKCDATGEIKVMDMDSVHSRSSGYPPDKTVECDECDEGYIEE